MAGVSTSDQRRRNRARVMREIVSRAPVSRTHLSQHTGLTGAAVSRITRELIDVGLVREGKTIRVKGQVGRRNIRLEMADSGAFVLGISLTANMQSVSIGNNRGEIIDQHRLDRLDAHDPKIMVDQLSQAAVDMVQTAKIDPARLVGCGIAVGGVADPGTGVLIRSDPLEWNNVPLGAMFSERLGMVVRLEGRAVSHLLAEQNGGLATAKNNVVLISNDLWIGGAMMLDGQVVKGQSNMIGQIGHLSVGTNQATCVCGRTGCLDASASGLAILRNLQHIEIPGISKLENPDDRLRALATLNGPENSEIRNAFLEAGRDMGHAVDAVLSMLDPEQILLTGVTHRHPQFIQGIQDTLREVRPKQKDWPVVVSRATSDQSAIWLALDAFVFSQALEIEQLKAI